MTTKTVLAIDLGAESGRVMAVHFDRNHFELEELHRFPNKAVTIQDKLHWDFLRLWSDIQQGIGKGKKLKPASIGLDTWGVDFALLDNQGSLIGNPVHYRDSRTEGMMEKVFEIVPQEEIFAQTGIQFISINTLYQLMSLVMSESPQHGLFPCLINLVFPAKSSLRSSSPGPKLGTMTAFLSLHPPATILAVQWRPFRPNQPISPISAAALGAWLAWKLTDPSSTKPLRLRSSVSSMPPVFLVEPLEL